MPHLCLIEDDPIMGESLHDRFVIEGFVVDWFRRADEAWTALSRTAYDAVVSDVRLPDGSGEDLFLRRSAAATACPPFVFITAYASVERAVDMLKRGASDYVIKPFDIGDLVDKVRRVAGGGTASAASTGGLLGVSRAMRSIESQLPRIAAKARTVLITGESGVGKEVIARRLHALTAGGAASPFVAVNCGAVPDTLIEAAFFGHERGAFTGADRTRKGYLEQADGGTLFLDEIGELPLQMQVKLLRALQDRVVQRLGAEGTVALDVRIVCATHVDLRDAVATGRFREDLYYRINVLQLQVPPLRDRLEDVPWLARLMLGEIAQASGQPPRELAPGAAAALLAHHWPGNARELRNRIERACVLTDSDVLHAQDLFENSSDDATAAHRDPDTMLTLDRYIAQVERDYLVAALARFGGRIGATAAALGISRKSLWEKSKRHGLNTKD